MDDLEIVLTTDGSDSLIGLMNHSPKVGPQTGLDTPNDSVGLHNSWYGS